MHPIRWLHISDLHMQNSQSSAQNAVLTAMLDDIKKRCKGGLAFDFVLVTGDLAFAGKETEYALVEKFFDNLATTIGLSQEKIFCIPGNHDVDRERQKMCFSGARSALQNQTKIYSFLGDAEERETLLKRQGNFREFQNRCFQGQEKERTDDELGYVSFIEIREIRIAIVGLNSAWLSEGGREDEGQLLLSEQQVKNAIEITRRGNPHVVIGMSHHPLDLLRDFDRVPNRTYLEETCQFFHCGHLHVADASKAASRSGRCLTLAAGASFESREAHNAYTTILLDPLHAKVDVTFVQYNPSNGTFSLEENQGFPYEVSASAPCDVGDLAHGLDQCCPAVIDMSYYLAAVLLGDISEVPLQASNGVAFGSVALLEKQPEDDFKVATINFLAVSNAIKLLSGRKTLSEILTSHSSPIKIFGEKVREICKTNDDVKEQLVSREANARKLAETEADGAFKYTLDLLDELLHAGEWDMLHEMAERNCGLPDPAAAAKAKRMLALCLVNSTESADREHAATLYRELSESANHEPGDWASLAELLTDAKKYDHAKETVRKAINVFPQNVDGFVEIGLKIVEATGDVDFREWLRDYKRNRR